MRHRFPAVAAAILLPCAIALLFWFTRPDVPSRAAAPRAEDRSSPAMVVAPKPSTAAAAVQPASTATHVPAPTATSVATQQDILPRFNQWLDGYIHADAATRQAMVPEGIALATARRPVFKDLIVEDPRAALEQAVPVRLRQQLPPEIVSLLEARVNGRAALRIYQGVGADNRSPAPTFRVAEFQSGETYTANVYGRRAESLRWLSGTSLHGVAIDEQLATHSDPVRIVEPGEIPDPGKPASYVCPVSGNTAVPEEERGQEITEETPAIEAFGELLYLCNGDHAIVYKEQLIYAEGSSGGAVAFTGILPAAPTPSIGNVKVLVIPMTFADQNDTPSSESVLYQLMRDVGDHYAKASYGKLTLVTTVTPTIKLPHNEAWYIQKDTSNGGTIDGLGMEHSHARAEARKLGFDDAEYDAVVVRLRGGPRTAGGWGGGSSVWIYGDGADVTAHEVGHCFGLAHANFWNTSGTSSIGVGANEEYGGHWDVMGGIGLPRGHYNAQGKNQIRWLPDTYVTEIVGSGTYRVYAQDQAVLDPGKRFALKIRKDHLRTYWGELRGLWTGDSSRTWADYGLILGWRYPGAGGGNWQLIDTTPGSPFGKDDSPISIGRTFSDTEAGIHFTTVAVNPATAEQPKSVDVVVNMGDFAGNQAPTLSLAASATVVPLNVPITFTASASDPDDDSLAYSWQHFGDTSYRVVAPNSPVITRTFTASGSYVVSCTVSDMKGGVATRNVLVIAGTGGSRYTISGRVTLDGQGVRGVLVNANSANGVITDSDGFFTIPNLTAATYVMTPLLYGYTFSELFNNSVTIGPSSTGADFEAAMTPRVSIAATTPACTENTPGSPARFTLTRTGDASQPLTVAIVTGAGTATATTDYSLSPAFSTGSQGFSNVTFAADADTHTITITPINDSTIEGPETVILQLGAGNGYIVEGIGQATVVINDDDTTLPKVSLALAEAKTAEGSAVPAQITFTRSGSTGNPLTVNYNTSGSASAGLDFVAPGGSIIIPAGSASSSLSITSINDTVAEQIENVVISIGTSPTFLADPVANTATVLLVDDDTQVLTVVATDATATERDLSTPGAVADTATFLITRSGDMSQALTVYYAVSGTNAGSMAGALHGVDYDALPGVLTIPAGEASAAVTIVPRWDGIGEGPETVTMQLGAGPTYYRLGSPNGASVTITDAGDPPYVEVLAVDNAVEGGTTGRFRFSLKGSAAGSVSVGYTVSGTATSGTDFTALSGTASIPGNGLNTVEVTVTAINDTTPEDLETVTLTITPSAAYQTFGPSSSATIWMYDNEQPTLFVDAHSSSYPPSFAESSTGSSFYVSRTGSTNASLTVNYILSGSATNGVDYQPLSGTTNIAAGRTGVDIAITPINDALAEGTETITLALAPGAYGRGPAATFYMTDDETPALNVTFSQSSAAVLENAGTAMVPVQLSAISANPVSVEYLVESGGRASVSVSGTAASPLPYWVRTDRIGTTVIGLISPDGTNWTSVSTQTVAMSSTYLAGLHVCSFNASQLSACTFDNVLITNLQAGATMGTRTGVNIGSTALLGSASVAGNVYTVNGAGDNVEGTTDQGYFTYWQINNSTSCTVIARVVTQQNTANGATAGVMIRESTGNTARRGYMAATPGSGFEFHYRANTGVAEAKAVSVPSQPLWVRIQRTGNILQGSQSSDGAAWTQVSTNQVIAFGPEILVGLGVSAQDEGMLATATIDNVTITAPSPTPALPLMGRTVGFTSTQGTDSESAGVYTITASGDGINGTSDDCFFVSTAVTGDFTLTARVTTLQANSPTPQAGVMVRERLSRGSRMMFLGGIPGAAPQLVWRTTTTTTANGAGVDFTLAPGVLTFPPGNTTQNIPVALTDDSMPEPDEPITIVLRNPTGARLGAVSQFTLAIVDNDTTSAEPFAGFASATANAAEASGTVQIPVTLSVPASASALVTYEITAGTAIAGSDFTAATGTVNFEPGDSVRYVPLELLDDAVIESSKTVLISLRDPAGLRFNTLTNQTFTIVDDDSPIVTISSTDTNASEAGGTASLTFTRTGSTASPLTINVNRAGTAVADTDYTGVGTNVVFDTGESTVTLTVTAVQDTTAESTETAIVGIAGGSGYRVGAPSSTSITILDDDRNVVTIAATTPEAREGGASGMLTLTRSGDISASLTVGFTVSGTATANTDYGSIGTSILFGADESTRTISISAINDTLTEGNEMVLVSINAGAYDVGSPSYASVTIVDNDIPPTVFISSPAAQGVVLAPTNGLFLEATASDDGSPQPLSFAWSAVTGPGAATFESPNTAGTPVTFSAPGVYLLRVSVTDGQFTVSDQIAVNVGGTNALPPSDWIAADIGPATARGYAGRSGSNWVLAVSGIGFATSSDRGHAVSRQVSGNGSMAARLVAIGGTNTAEAGVTIRDGLHRYSRRAALLYQASSRTLRFRSRLTSNSTDFSINVANQDLPLWLRLDRDTTAGTVSAWYATDNAGAPNAWTQVGTNVNIAMDATADYGLTGDSSSDTVVATALLDNVSLTPAPSGPATVAEDFGGMDQVGTYSYSAGTDTHTLNGKGSLDGSGMFWGQQFTGDFVLTVLQLDATSSANNARSGLMIRDSMDDGSMVFFGRNPVGSFSCFVWRTNPKGGTSGLGGVTQKQRWFRIIRRGNQVIALHAPNNSGVPGAWVQLGLPQTAFMQPTIIAGLYCDNSGGVGLNTATFSKFSIVPLNNAPVVDPGLIAASPSSPLALNGRVRDDGLPYDFTSEWMVASAPGPVTFSNAMALATTASFTVGGTYTLRLTAHDGLARSFADLTFNYSAGGGFAQWQTENFVGGSGNPDAAPEADSDNDGLNNVGEYGLGTNPNVADARPITATITTNGANEYLRMTITRNAAATDAAFVVEAGPEVNGPWSNAGLVVEANTPSLLQVRDGVAVTPSSRRYMRVRISLP